MSNALIERFLRNNLDDDDYKEYSAALDELCTPKRQWVGLTDEEFRQINRSTLSLPIEDVLPAFATAIEAKLKEKNT